jgi:predicted nucleotidyltransferase
MPTSRIEIFKCRVGSRLYGTNLPDSDEDFASVFLPSVRDLCGLGSCPESIKKGKKISEGAKNHKGDIDDKAMSLLYFFSLLLKGDIIATEMLFAPASSIVHEHYIFKYMIKPQLLDYALSKKSVRALMGMARSKATSPKDMSHKFRAAYEAIGLLQSLEILFPLPQKQIDKIVEVKKHKIVEDYSCELAGLCGYADSLYAQSDLRERPDTEAVEEICLTTLLHHIKIGYKGD